MKRTALASAAASVTALFLAVGLSACQEQVPVSGGSTSPAVTATAPGPQTQDPGTTGHTLTEAHYQAPAGNNVAQYLSFSLIPQGFEIHDADNPDLLLLLPPEDDEQGLLAQLTDPGQTITDVRDAWSSSSSLTNARYTLGNDTTVGGLSAGTFLGTGIGQDGRYVTERAAYVDHEGRGFFFLLRRSAYTEASSEISDDEFYGVLDGVVWAV